MYVPLDVNFPDDDKIESVGLIGSGLYCQALCVAKRVMTDGRLTRAKLRKLGADDALIDLCVRADLFRESDDGTDDVWITAWLDHNESAEEVEAKRANDARRKRVTRAKRPRGQVPPVPSDSERSPAPVRPLEVEVEVAIEVEEEAEVASPSAETGLVLHDVSLSAVAPAARSRREYPDAFEDWWNAYPLEFRKGKGKAHDEWRKAKANMPEAQLLEVIRLHAAAWDAKGERFVPNPATWLHQRRYDDPPPVVGSRRVRSDRQQRNDTILEDFVRGAG